MSDGGFPTMDGRKLGGRNVEWQDGRMTRPDPDSAPPRPAVPVAGLLEFVAVLVGIGLVVAGCSVAWGLAGGLIAGGMGVLLAVVWTGRGGRQ